MYQIEDGLTRFEVQLEEDTLWLISQQMVELLDCDSKNFRKHCSWKKIIKNRTIGEHFANVLNCRKVYIDS